MCGGCGYGRRGGRSLVAWGIEMENTDTNGSVCVCVCVLEGVVGEAKKRQGKARQVARQIKS